MNQELNEQELAKKKQEEANKPKSKEEQKKELANTFGISLADIEHVQLDNGKEFFKFYNPQTQTVKMIENREHGINLSQNFKSIQQELSYAQGKDERTNAREIYEHNMKHKNIEINLISLAELKYNRSKYKKQIDSLSTIDRKKIVTLIKYSKELELTHINLENAIAIDENRNVIDVQYDYAKNKAVIKTAKVLNYQDQKQDVEDENLVVQLSDEEFDSIVDKIIVSSDDATIKEAEEIEVRGERIRTNELNEFVEMPEAVERIDNPRRRGIIGGLVRAIERRRQLRQRHQHQNQARVLQYTNNRNNNNNHGQAA